MNANGQHKLQQRYEKNPYNQCLYHALSKQDPTSPVIQKLYILITVLSTATCLVLPQVTMLYGLDGSWDEEQGLRIFDIGGLLHATLGMNVKLPLIITASYLLTLTMLDLLGFGWPKSWSTENTQCYEEMFSEPTRDGHLIRRFGNTLSNAPYVVCSVITAHSCLWGEIKNVFRTADFMFAIMVFILAVASTIWHASNAPTSHYVDIWSMNASIVFLGIRASALGIYVLLKRANVQSDLAEIIASRTCIILFLFCIVSDGGKWRTRHRNRFLHEGAPFSVRARLKSKSTEGFSVIGMILGDFPDEFPLPRILDLSVYCAMPVIFTFPYIVSMYFLFNSLGSVHLLIWKDATLIIGWSYRSWERWLLDGCAPMNFMISQIERKNTSGIQSGLLTIGAALTSPTAVLHIFTGVALIAGYMHVRSLDLVILGT